MDDLNFSSRTNKVLKLCKKIGIDNLIDEFSDEQIAEYNRRSLLSDRTFRKITHKIDNRVYNKTFIIPVDSGVVTGYFFEKPLNNTSNGLNSLIIYFHGGGWTLGNMEKHYAFCNMICSITGCSVLSVDYRLAPINKFPVPLEDCYATFLWAVKGARYWGVDPERIYLMGDCAGANLAIGVARLSRDRKGPKIAGQALLCPITDCRMRTKSYEDFADGPVLTAKAMNFLIKNYQREPKDIMDPGFSPMLSKDLSRMPETLIIVADNDLLCDDGKIFASALDAADTPVKLLEVKDTFHGFYYYPQAYGTEEFMNAIRQFFGGRPLKNIELMSNRNRRRLEKSKTRSLFGILG